MITPIIARAFTLSFIMKCEIGSINIGDVENNVWAIETGTYSNEITLEYTPNTGPNNVPNNTYFNADLSPL